MPDAFYRSAEIRWFLPAHDQWDQFLHWFRLRDRIPVLADGSYDPTVMTEPFVKLEPARTDEYLLLPECTTVGLKRRQGMLEVKALAAGPFPFSTAAAAGQVDEWVKWSYRPSAAIAQALEAELDLYSPWRSVVKQRYLRQVSLDHGDPVAVSPDQQPEAGVTIELTMVDVEATPRAWLTFGFEALGPSVRLRTQLEEAVRRFFAEHGPAPVPLDSTHSLSYPAWLARLR